jgi:WD40 repeat protein
VFSSRTLLASGKPESVTSVAFAPRLVSTQTRSVAVLAVGLENGIVELWYVPLEAIHGSPVIAYVLPADHCHNAAVTKLAWRPQNESTQDEDFVLAGASSDHGCRIWRIRCSHEEFNN